MATFLAASAIDLPAAGAQPVPTATSPVPGAAEELATPEEPGFMTNLWTRSNALGDMGGLRTFLGRYGVTIGLQETSEVLGNVTGGVQQGAVYTGLTVMGLGLDTEKAFGWEGGTFNISALQIAGRSLTTNNLLNLQTVSSIEADRSTRIWEVWFQQAFLHGKADIKLGEQSIDQEFITSQGGSLFVNASMGWPVLPSANLYAGGPAYPLSSLGVRLRAEPSGSVTVLGGVFDDNPPGGPFNDDSQVRGAEQSGTKFNTTTGALFIAEVQYALNQPATGDMATTSAPTGLPGEYKLGLWYDTGSFPDQRYDAEGLSLADLDTTGEARMLKHNWSIYGVVDQMVWRPAEDSPQAVGVFARAMGSPGDRNLVNFSFNGGVTLKAPLPGRDGDEVGIGYGLANISPEAGGLDKDRRYFSGEPYPVRSSESFIEITYQYLVAPWWNVQPDFQYIWMPAGGIPNPNEPGKRIGNEAVFGLRTNVTF